MPEIPLRTAARAAFSSAAIWSVCPLNLSKAARPAPLNLPKDFAVLGPAPPVWPTGVDRLRYAAPLLLWVRGDAELLASKLVAITGTRRPSEQGRREAEQLAREYSERSWTVASGGSYGIDAAAHRGALAAGGKTVALLASGVDFLFPSGNTDLLTQICIDGALVSERPPGTAPRAWRFQRRNKVLKALLQVTAVIEDHGSEKSCAGKQTI